MPALPSFSPVETTIGAILLFHSTTALLYGNGTILGISGLLRRVVKAPFGLTPTQAPKSQSSTESSPSSSPSTTHSPSERTRLLGSLTPAPTPTSCFLTALTAGSSGAFFGVAGIALSVALTALVAPDQLPHYSTVIPPLADSPPSSVSAIVARSAWIVFVGALTGWGTNVWPQTPSQPKCWFIHGHIHTFASTNFSD